MPRGMRVGEEIKERIKELTDEGWTQEAISTSVGLSKSTIHKIQQEMLVSPLYHNRGGWHAKTIANEVRSKGREQQQTESYVMVNNKTVELIGINTGFKYTAMTKGKDLSIETGYGEPITIDLKDLVNFSNELMSVAEKIEEMKKDVWSV